MRINFKRARWTSHAGSDSRELLALGMFGAGACLGDRIEFLLRHGRESSTHVSKRRVMITSIALLALGVAATHAPEWIAFAQTPPAPNFEVSSIKPHRSGDTQQRVTSFGNGHFAAENLELDFLLQMAYRMRSFQIKGGPDWIGSEHYDIGARAEGASREQMYLYLQSLLADRFKLRAHREVRQMPVFELHVARGGAQLQPGRQACFDPLKPATQPGPNAPDAPCGGFFVTPGSIVGASVPIEQLIKPLGDSLGREVIDKTGLTGTYDVHLQWTPQGAVDGENRSLITALQEMGLRLASTRGPVETLVIDHLEKPDPN